MRDAELQRRSAPPRRPPPGLPGRDVAVPTPAPIATATPASLHHVLGRRPVVEAPDRERRAARRLEADRAVIDRAAGSRRTAAGRRSPRRATNPVANNARPRTAPAPASPRDRASPAPARAPAARTSSARRAATAAPARSGLPAASSASEHQRGDERVVGVAVRREDRERVRHPRVGERDAERPVRAPAVRSGTATPRTSRSKAIAATCAAGRSSQLPAPAERLTAGT